MNNLQQPLQVPPKNKTRDQLLSHVTSIVTTETDESPDTSPRHTSSINTSRYIVSSGLAGSPMVKVENQKNKNNVSPAKGQPFQLQMKKPKGCPADGIEGFRLFMIGQKEKPQDIMPAEVKRKLTMYYNQGKKGSKPDFDPKQNVKRTINLHLAPGNLKSP